MEEKEYYLDEMKELRSIVERIYLFHDTHEPHEIQRGLEKINLISNDLLYELYGLKVHVTYPDE